MAKRLTLADVYTVLVSSTTDRAGEWPELEGVPLNRWATLVSRVVIDSRQVVPGSVFVALCGERTDGHEYVCDAFERGARCAIVERIPNGMRTAALVVDLTAKNAEDTTRHYLENKNLSDVPPDVVCPLCLIVEDTLGALQRLAAWWRARFSVRVFGITGSIGKTTTKEYIASVLSQRYRVLKSQGNYNNEIGLPLTLLDLNESHERAVLEMGTYGPGEIALLSQIARPLVGIVTNVGPVHLERMGTIERITEAKAELPRSLPSGGIAILNADDTRVRSMAQSTSAHVFLYGLAPGGPESSGPESSGPESSGPESSGPESGLDLWADHVESLGLDGIRFRFHYTPRKELSKVIRREHFLQEQVVHAHLPMVGRHSVYTALCAASAGLIEGLTWNEILRGLRTAEQPRLLARPGINGVTLLDDTYNSSPDSAIAALNLLEETSGRKVAVLGDMLELGVYELEGHRRVARRAMDVVSMLITVGERGRLIGQEALRSGMSTEHVIHVSDNEAAIACLQSLVQEGDTVLVKGSRGMAMEQIVEALAAPVADAETQVACQGRQ